MRCQDTSGTYRASVKCHGKALNRKHREMSKMNYLSGKAKSHEGLSFLIHQDMKMAVTECQPESSRLLATMHLNTSVCSYNRGQW